MKGRLKALFWDNAPVPRRPRPPLDPRYHGLRAALTAALIVPAFVWPMRIIGAIAAEIAPVDTPVAGAWRVDDVQGGPPMDRAGRWEKIFFERVFKGREGIVSFREELETMLSARVGMAGGSRVKSREPESRCFASPHFGS